jgi:hypothetical protein
MAKKKIDGVKVPKKILGHKLNKATRKDIAALVNRVKHPDGRSLALAAVAAVGPLLAERLTHKSDKPTALN